MKYYLHEFRVRMIVEDVETADRAHRWMATRLNGGDAAFEISHTGAIRALTSKEAKIFHKTGKYPL